MKLSYIIGVKDIIKKLFSLLIRRHKLYLLILFALTLLLSLIETIGVSIIMPFVSVASSPAALDEGVYKKVYDFLGFASKERFVFIFGIGIIGFYIFRAIFSVLYTYLQTQFSLGMSRSIAEKLFRIFLSIPYKSYVQKNPSEMGTVISEAGNVSSLLQNFLLMCSEIILVIILYGFLIALNWSMTLVLTAILAAALILIMRIIAFSKRQGQKRYEASVLQGRTVNETFWNIKFVKLSSSEESAIKSFDKSARKVARANVLISTIGNMPKNILESLGFTLLIGAILFILWAYHTPDKVVPIIAMYALALYRILPSVNRMLSNINTILGFKRSLEVVYTALQQETETECYAELPFKKSIRLDNISFRYITGGEVLRNVSLEIQKGDKIALTGESGGGKSTLVDIIIGIHKPNSGKLYIDNTAITNNNIRSWRSKIGYIPQDIFLFDGTVAENVAFCMTADEQQLIKVLKMANIWDFLAQKDGIHTRVGNNGILLSGGQKQRIGIARALYCEPEVLVLDEATSALDNETEGRIMDEIYHVSSGKTLIVIAHRLSTVERCDRRVIIENGSLREISQPNNNQSE
jgi:ATP-binding cassette subfamily B protein/ATP-binding cassette subfamily C protein